MLLRLGENTIPDIVLFTKSEVKVIWVTFVINYIQNILQNID